MTADAAQYLGAGLAAMGIGLASIGVGLIFAFFLQGALRNPAAAASQQGNLILGFAVAEALGIFAFLVSLILLFVV
ncbi:F0F1 ATP synthase subunit C [Pacificimonas flava]|uniref:ATP synthase subunit c n=1 Tax=Pacificimonas flava TaxID=1234595 RepID=M2U972_9SPHN|nr:F0F1 ATP synthase subunit C [Pacificimonas flava]EMD84512.1 ATP synthase C chain [Pacificimonas flava]MBB5279616.1 F-type H+-transporting ATPase subunit c [Pacificimonas flava]